jgi:protein-L-isoaspartate(D-aspartate) O-methyltransferase
MKNTMSNLNLAFYMIGVRISGMNAEDTRKIRLIMHLRNLGITNTDVLSAMEKTPREIFVPDAMMDQAYEDIALPIGRGQTISQPYVVAIMTQALEISDRDKILEIGTGSGYQACILARLCRRVYTIERHKPLLRHAEEVFKTLGLHNITSIAGDGMKGWPQQAPFDKIIVTAAARSEPPQALLDQLKIGGLMIIPVGQSGAQSLRLYRKEGEDTFAVKDILPVRFVPLLPEIASDSESVDQSDVHATG